MRLATAAALLLASLAAMVGSAGGALADVVARDIRLGIHPDKTRMVVEFDRSVDFSLFTLDAPYRVVIDLPQVGWNLPPQPLQTDVGLIERFRYGLFKPGTSRLVIDLKGPARVKDAFVIPPRGSHGHRFVLDLAETSRSAFLGEAGAPAIASTAETTTAATTSATPAAASASATPVAAGVMAPFASPKAKPERHVVVIDPGHGGVDPGAIGVSGGYEKHITLAVGRALKERLEATGRYRVHLTRDRDVFIRLRDRIRIARDLGAELFISLHADSMANKKVRGLSVYTLSETASDKEAAALAERENKADLIAGVDLSHENRDVTNILIDLAQRETMNQSARFASSLVHELGRQVKLLRNSHRFAGFAVLKAPDVPSVLIELGFLSNTRDERALRDPRHRAKLAGAIQQAIEGHFRRVEQAQGW